MEAARHHKRKLENFCRCCGLNVEDQKLVHKSKIEGIASDVYGEDFKDDEDSRHPERVCNSCYQKFNKLKMKKLNHDNLKAKNPKFYKDSVFQTEIEIDFIASCIVHNA